MYPEQENLEFENFYTLNSMLLQTQRPPYLTGICNLCLAIQGLSVLPLVPQQVAMSELKILILSYHPREVFS